MSRLVQPEYRLAVQVILKQKDQVLLLGRQNTGYEDGKYGLPAGHIEFGETVKSAAVREAAEEVGATIDPDHLAIVGTMHRLQTVTYVDFFLTCSTWTGEIENKEPEKCDGLLWANVNDLPHNMVHYVELGLSLGTTSAWFHQLIE